MAVGELNVAAAALVIAISALVIASGQLLQQLFSAADGIRRCQRSVIGDWYKLVRLRFRWSSFRFEVEVTTPHFQIANVRSIRSEHFYRPMEERTPKAWFPIIASERDFLVRPEEPVALLGTRASYQGTYSVRGPKRMYADNNVTWVSLLAHIHEEQRHTVDRPIFPVFDHSTSNLSLICISRRTRSWDFMPPDIVRPVASTTIASLVTIAHRSGMNWSHFDPDEGKLRASGLGRSFSTSVVRGMGLVVEYNDTGSTKHLSLRIPSAEADQLACGIIGSISLRDSSISLIEVLTRCFNVRYGFQYSFADADVAALQDSLPHSDETRRLPGFSDLLGLWSGWLRVPIAPRNYIVDNPFPFPVTAMGEVHEARIVWRWLLKQQTITCSAQCKLILETWENWPRFYDSGENYSAYNRCTDSRILDYSKMTYDRTTAYFEKLGTIHGEFYKCLTYQHIKLNLHSLEQAGENIRSGLSSNRNPIYVDTTGKPYKGDPMVTEQAFIYAENRFKLAEEVLKRDEFKAFSSTDIEDAWWMLMLRMQAWYYGIEMVARVSVAVPSRYYDDHSRVYIL